MENQKKINLTINLDDKHMCSGITCDGDDIQGEIKSKAMLLSLFDEESLDTVRIDLWKGDLQISEMDRLIFQTLRSLSDTYYKATHNAALANDMQAFVDHFGRKTGILTES